MITSLHNPLVKRLIRLHQRRQRRREAVFLIEGETELAHAAASGIELETIVYCPQIISANQRLNSPAAIAVWADSLVPSPPQVLNFSQHVYAGIAYRQNVQGILAIARPPQLSLAQLHLPPAPLLLIVDAVEKPGNLGALLRSADAAGVDLVIVCDANIDLYNPNVIRSSLGALFTVQILIASAPQTRQWLDANAIKTVLSSPSAQRDYRDVDYTAAVAIVLGSENQGLSPEWLDHSDCRVKLPMRGRMDSLNVASCGAVLLYEALRQRHPRK